MGLVIRHKCVPFIAQKFATAAINVHAVLLLRGSSSLTGYCAMSPALVMVHYENHLTFGHNGV